MLSSESLFAMYSAVFTSAFQPLSNRTRFAVLFWMTLAETTAMRVGQLLGSDGETTSYKNFALQVSRSTVTLLFSPGKGKTALSNNTDHVLVRREPLYRDPVYLFLVLASYDQALDVDPEDIFSRGDSVKPGADVAVYLAKDSKRDSPIFATGNGQPMNTERIRYTLASLSQIARLDGHVTPHAFRRLVATYKSLRSKFRRSDTALVAGAYGQRTPSSTFSSSSPTKWAARSSESIRRMSCQSSQDESMDSILIIFRTRDINRMVWGGSDDCALDVYAFHPDATRSHPDMPVALSLSDRRQVLDSANGMYLIGRWNTSDDSQSSKRQPDWSRCARRSCRDSTPSAPPIPSVAKQ